MFRSCSVKADGPPISLRIAGNPAKAQSGQILLTQGNISVTFKMVLEVRYYISEDGRSTFEEWFSSVEDSVARAKVAAAITRLMQGNTSNVKSVGKGVLEYRINFGSGYRVYFGRDGATLVILLTGGTKTRQQRDIETAMALWAAYKKRKRLGR